MLGKRIPLDREVKIQYALHKQDIRTGQYVLLLYNNKISPCRRITTIFLIKNQTSLSQSLTAAHLAELGPGDLSLWVPHGFGSYRKKKNSGFTLHLIHAWASSHDVCGFVLYRAVCQPACWAAPGSGLAWWRRRTASWEPRTAETTLPAEGWGRTSDSEDEERKLKLTTISWWSNIPDL